MMLVNQGRVSFFLSMLFFLQVNIIIQKAYNYVKLGDQATMH